MVVPDFFHGDPFVYTNANRPLPIWLKDHEPVSSNLPNAQHGTWIFLVSVSLNSTWIYSLQYLLMPGLGYSYKCLHTLLYNCYNMLLLKIILWKLLVFQLWQDKGFEEAKAVIEALKSKGISAIGAAGFCWGGE